MNAKLNYDDAMSYYLNMEDMKRAQRKYMWVCPKCKTKNMEVNKNCYNCGGRR